MSIDRPSLPGALTVVAAVVGILALTHDAAIDPGTASAAAITDGVLSVTARTTMPLTLPNGAPGTSATSQVQIINDGDLPAVVRVTAQADDADTKGLGAAVEVRADLTTGPCAPVGNRAVTTSLDAQPTDLRAPHISLAPGQAATACVHVLLPLDLPNELQGATTNLTIGIDSTQETS